MVDKNESMGEPVRELSVEAKGQAAGTSMPKEPLIAAAIIVAVSVSIAVGGIVVKTRERLQRDRLEFLADGNAKQVAPLRRVIQLRLSQSQARLVQFAAARAVSGPGRARSYGEFALVSLMTPTANGQWGANWIEKGPLYTQLQSESHGGSGATLGANQEFALLKSLPYDRIREGEMHWQRLSDDKGRPLWALAVSVETSAALPATNGTAVNGAAAQAGARVQAPGALPDGVDYRSVQVGTGGRAVVVGFFARNPLLAATEDFIGSTSTAFVIDSRGYAATHSNKTMIGALLKDDPAVKQVFSARASAGATRYQDEKGTRVFAAFEQVDRANLYVVMSTPESAVLGSGDSFVRTAVTAGAMAILVGLLLVFAWGARLIPRAQPVTIVRRTESPMAHSPIPSGSFSNVTMEPVGRPNAARISAPANSVKALELPPELLKQPQHPGAKQGTESLIGVSDQKAADDRAKFIQRFMGGLENSMKEPLLAAMAHIQLAKSKSTEAAEAASGAAGESMREIVDHVESIERDLRRAKETVDELADLAGEGSAPTEKDRSDLSKQVAAALAGVRGALQGESIEIEEKIAAVPMIRGRDEALQKAIREILLNTVQALRSRSDKKVSIKLEDAGDMAVLTVRDNGVGMDRDTRAQAFEPFFHGYEDPTARGLGLARVKAIMLAHRGSFDIVSAPGDGTTVTLRWPITSAEREVFEKLQATVPAFEQTAASVFGGAVDFGEEGAVSLGGKVPLPNEQAASLPPPPRFGSGDEGSGTGMESVDADDDEDDSWSFKDAKPVARGSVQEDEDTVRVRPVTRG